MLVFIKSNITYYQTPTSKLWLESIDGIIYGQSIGDVTLRFLHWDFCTAQCRKRPEKKKALRIVFLSKESSYWLFKSRSLDGVITGFV